MSRPHNSALPDVAVPPLTTIGADDLLAMDLPPVRMVVGNHIPAGVLLLAGDPKVGKSLLMQHLAVCVAMGQPAWGSLEVEAGSVLYLANEGGQRSFKERLARMLDGTPAPGHLRIAETKEPLGERLEVQLGLWLAEADEPRLVVIDTYSSVAPDTKGVNRHQEDYNALAALADLGSQFPDTLIAVVHHTRKAEGEDVMHRISGSQGMTAATDGNAVLARQPAARRCLLSIRPRNAEESDLVLERNAERLTWSVVGDDERAQLSAGRQRILSWFDKNPDGGGPKTIADDTGMDYESVRQFLTQMAEARQVEKPKRGWYRLGSDDAEAA